jgi:hypothetical protein
MKIKKIKILLTLPARLLSLFVILLTLSKMKRYVK